MKEIMKGSRRTRYFVFFKVNPVKRDFEFLSVKCKEIDAHWGWKVVKKDGRRRLSGFIILRGPRTNVHDLSRCFPNFLVKVAAVDGMKFDDFPEGVQVFGKNPFFSVRKNLVDEFNAIA